MYLDESGDHSLNKIDPQFPVFCLAGCIFDSEKYIKYSELIDKFKLKYFDDKNVILHSREIRKCTSPFNILLNKNTKTKFYRDLDKIMANMSYTIIASAILKQNLCDHYSDPTNPYDLSLRFIMERFLFYLEEKREKGYLSVESRDPKSNTDLLNAFTEIINNGSNCPSHHIIAERFQDKIEKLDFVTKKQNDNGHQVADLVAYPIANYAMYRTRKNLAFEVIKNRFRSRNNRIMGYGLKIFP